MEISKEFKQELLSNVLAHAILILFLTIPFALMGAPMAGIWIYLFFMGVYFTIMIVGALAFSTLVIPALPVLLWREHKKEKQEIRWDALLKKSQEGFVAHPEEPDTYILKGYAYHKDEIDDEPFLKMLFEREQDLGHPVFMRHDFLYGVDYEPAPALDNA